MSMLMRTAKLGAGATVAAVGTAGAQFVYFESTYKPLKAPKGATEGIEHAVTPDPRARLLALGQKAKESSASLKRRVSEWRKSREQVDSTGTSDVASVGLPHSPPVADPRVVRRILFVGDSLIAGVGCMHGEAVLPRHVARIIADDLGVDVQWQAWAMVGGDVRQLQAQIWILQIRSNKFKMREYFILPELDKFLAVAATAEKKAASSISGTTTRRGTNSAEVAHSAASAPSPSAETSSTNETNDVVHVDAVVVMCGLNDWKRVASGTKSPSQFHDDLHALTDALHARLGSQCRVVYPALPLPWTTAFPQPLFSVVLTLSNAWDAQKQRLAREVGNSGSRAAAAASDSLVKRELLSGPAPAVAEGAVASTPAAEEVDAKGALPPPFRRAVDFVTCPPDLGGPWNLASDGVHPNEDGYALWAEHIASALASKLKLYDKARREGRNRSDLALDGPHGFAASRPTSATK